jgi:hypothetical protein
VSTVTETELFAAYRFPSGYAAQCACGIWITAPSSASPVQVGEAVLVHNSSTDHVQWSREQEAIAALRGSRHVCICKGEPA